MTKNSYFDVIIIGGSYSGLAAGMALGRALKNVLIIDSGNPCNKQTPHSHNFITHDGKTPKEITELANLQVKNYDTVKFFNGLVTSGLRTEPGFEIQVFSGEKFLAKKLIFASGIRDIMQDISGYAECWGISVLHCPYCHGYEIRSEKTGILGNGEYGYELTRLISNWTKYLALFTNGPSGLSNEQMEKLDYHGIKVVEKKIAVLEHSKGYIQHILFEDGRRYSLTALYARSPFEQHCRVPEFLGCELNEDGYIKVNPFQETSIKGVFACGDNATRMRTVANSVAMGTTAGMTASKDIIIEEF